MADTSNLSNFLTDVANAIRTKKEATDKIPAENFDSEILSIETGGSGDVKLFETEEEMQADETAKEGDLAVVYRSEIQNATVDSQFQTAIFPETVVLDTAITDYVDVRYGAVDNSVMFDCWGYLNANNFTMNCYTESGSIRINYTSEDGITYTRTDGGEKTIDFGTEIYYEYEEMWNDVIGKFIQCGGNTFEGLYEYKSYIDTNNYVIFDNCKVEYIDNTWKGTYNVLNDELSTTDYLKIKTILAKFITDSLGFALNSYLLEKIDDATYKAYMYLSNTTLYKCDFIQLLNDTTVYPLYIGAYLGHSTSTIKPIYVCEINLVNSECTLINTITSMEITADMNGNNTAYATNETITKDRKFVLSNNITIDITSSTIVKKEATYTYQHPMKFMYLYASTQLNLASTNELLPGKIAYGKNGVVEGDGSIYNNLDSYKLFETTTGIPIDNITNIVGYIDADVMTPNKFLYGLKRVDRGPYFLSEKIKLAELEDTIPNNRYSYTTDTGEIYELKVYSTYFIVLKDDVNVYDSREMLPDYNASGYNSATQVDIAYIKNHVVTVVVYSLDYTATVYKGIHTINLTNGKVNTVATIDDLTLSETSYLTNGMCVTNTMGGRLCVLYSKGYNSSKILDYDVLVYDAVTETSQHITYSYTGTAYGMCLSPGILVTRDSYYIALGTTYGNIYRIYKWDITSDSINFEKLNDYTASISGIFGFGYVRVGYENDNCIFYPSYHSTYRLNKSTGTQTKLDLGDYNESIYCLLENREYVQDLNKLNITFDEDTPVITTVDSLAADDIWCLGISSARTVASFNIREYEDSYLVADNIKYLTNSQVKFYRYDITDDLTTADVIILACENTDTNSKGIRYLHLLCNYNNTISPEEYDVALDTASEILGEEV